MHQVNSSLLIVCQWNHYIARDIVLCMLPVLFRSAFIGLKIKSCLFFSNVHAKNCSEKLWDWIVSQVTFGLPIKAIKNKNIKKSIMLEIVWTLVNCL